MTHGYLYFVATILIIIILKEWDFLPVIRDRIHERQHLALVSWHKLDSSQLEFLSDYCPLFCVLHNIVFIVSSFLVTLFYRSI
jgi:hypothetical protein